MSTPSDSGELPLARDLPAGRPLQPKVIGLGGAGASIVRRLQAANLAGLALAVVDTDESVLAVSSVPDRTLLGAALMRGVGAAGDPALGREAALADPDKIAALVKDCDLVFLVGGLGGGTGAGVAPVVAEAATRAGALVLAFVTLPFSFERGRVAAAEDSLRTLRAGCDAVLPLPNDILLQAAAEHENARHAFARADEWIGRAVRSVWTMLSRPGLIPLDLARLQQAFATRGGRTLFGLGQGAGPAAVADAVASLRQCPLLQSPEFARKAYRLLVSILGGPGLTLQDVATLMDAVAEQFGRDPLVIPGAAIDDAMGDRVEIVVLGSCDLGGRRQTPRRPSARDRAAAAVVPEPAPAEAAQNEFAFGMEAESRGYFDKTDRNLFEGQDLDVPTYQRKGIKLVL